MNLDKCDTAGSFSDRIWPEIDVRARIRRAALTATCRSRTPARIRGRCQRRPASP